MKAKIKATGEIVSVSPTYNLIDSNDPATYYTDGKLGLWVEEELDFLPEKETAVMEGWVARDEDGCIYLFQDNPTRNTDLSYGFWHGNNDDFIELPTDSFPSVTWQSEPKKVKITIEEI